MANNRKAYLVFVLLVALASCSKLAMLPGGGGAGDGGLAIEVSTGGWASGAASRTVAPAQLTAADLADTARYTVRVSGRRSRGGALPETAVALDAGGRGVLPGLEDGLWHLTMTAYDAAGAVALLSGDATVEVRGPGSRAGFVLTPTGVAGTGTLSLALTWSEEDRSYAQASYPTQLTVALALYRPGTDSMVANSRAIWTRSRTNTTRIGTALSYTGFRNTGQSPRLAAGEYELRFTITGGNVPDGVTLEWRDNVYIEPGRETTGSVTIPRLSRLPQAPSGMAGSATALAAATGWRYTGTLTWSPGYNAESHELEVLEYATGTALPTGDAAWTAAAAAAGSAVHRYTAVPGDPDNYSGTAAGRPAVTTGHLLANSPGVGLALEAAGGRSCTARVRSLNSHGASAWVYLQAPLVPAPVAPSRLTGAPSSIDMAGGASTFPVALEWDGGYVDGGGTWELQVLSFTGGTSVPSGEAAWNGAAGRAEHTLTAAAPASGPASVPAGGLSPASGGATLTLRDEAAYYGARIRGRSSTGAATAWVYLDGGVMVPLPAIVGHSSTQATRWTIEQGTGRSVQVWDSDLTIWGPLSGSGMRMEWIKLAVGAQDGPVTDDAAWAYLYGLPLNSGSGAKTLTIRGSGTNRMPDMNKDMAFAFRIRLETPFGASRWFYYPDEVTQAP